MNHQEYINELARQSAQKQASLNKKAAANIVKGFAQGGPVGAIVAGVKAAREKGKNLRNSAKEMDSAMLEQGKMANEELMNESDNQLAQNQQALQDVVNNSNIQTGNVFNGNAQPNPIQDPISLYQDSLRQQGFNDDVVNGVRQGLNSGHKEIDQWIKQYNNGAGRENPINIPQTDEEIAAARAGSFNTPIQNGGIATESTEDKVKQGILDKFIDGITDLSKGYNENKNTAFNPENLRRRQDLATFKQSINPADYTTRLTPEEQKQFNVWANDMRASGAINPNDKFQDYDMQGYWKNEVLNNTDLANGNAQAHFTDKYKMPNHATFSNESIYATGDNAKYAGHWDNGSYVTPLKNNKMTRAGEVLGTISRAAKNPLVYGTLAGGIAAAMGNPYALGIGAKYAQEKAMSNIYRDVLSKHGINIPETVLGNVTNKDMDAIMLPELKKLYYNSMTDWRNQKLEDDKEYRALKLLIDQMNADSNAIKAEASKTKADKYNGGGKGSSTKTAEPSGQYVIGETPSGKQVKVPVERVKEFKSNGGKIVG